MRTTLKIILVLVILLSGCQSKVSPQELISKIKQKGYAVEQGTSIAAFVNNSEEQFWLTIEGKKIAAYLFSSPETAEFKAGGLENGYSNGYWAFEYVTPETKMILEESLK